MLSYFLLTTVYLFTCTHDMNVHDITCTCHVHTLIPLFFIFEHAQSMATQTRVIFNTKDTSIFTLWTCLMKLMAPAFGKEQQRNKFRTMVN